MGRLQTRKGAHLRAAEGEWQPLKQTLSSNGKYWAISLTRGDGKSVRRYVHRWMAMAFYGPPPPGMQCRHLDGDRDNNVLSNVRYGTAAENYADKVSHGTALIGERQPTSKLKERDVLVIREALERGVAGSVIALVFNVNKTLIHKIKHREAWAWLHPNHQESDAA